MKKRKNRNWSGGVCCYACFFLGGVICCYWGIRKNRPKPTKTVKRYTHPVDHLPPHPLLSGWRKRGVEFEGGNIHDGFGSFEGFGGSAEDLAVLPSSSKIQCQEATVTVLTVLAASAVVAVFGRDG